MTLVFVATMTVLSLSAALILLAVVALNAQKLRLRKELSVRAVSRVNPQASGAAAKAA